LNTFAAIPIPIPAEGVVPPLNCGRPGLFTRPYVRITDICMYINAYIMDRACCTFNYYNYNSLLRTRVCVCRVRIKCTRMHLLLISSI